MGGSNKLHVTHNVSSPAFWQDVWGAAVSSTNCVVCLLCMEEHPDNVYGCSQGPSGQYISGEKGVAGRADLFCSAYRVKATQVCRPEIVSLLSCKMKVMLLDLIQQDAPSLCTII